MNWSRGGGSREYRYRRSKQQEEDLEGTGDSNLGTRER